MKQTRTKLKWLQTKVPIPRYNKYDPWFWHTDTMWIDKLSSFMSSLPYLMNEVSRGRKYLHIVTSMRIFPAIHFFSRSGDLLRSCVTQGEDGTVYNPWSFCLDVAGNILITDTERHDVKILSPSGHLIHEIGKEGQEREQFVYPCGICVTESGIVFVLSWNYNFGLQSF